MGSRLLYLLFPAVCLLLSFSFKEGHSYDLQSHPDGINLTTPELIELQGYPAEIHHVTTEDGYILELHRIPHGLDNDWYQGKKVAFLQHCLLCSSADYIMNDPDKALAYMLADAGYDVWLGNFRGNTYSRNHTDLDSDNDLAYWQFNWDEMGIIDLPTMIDYVLDFTSLPDLYYVGFSMGTTTFFAMMSEKPEYKEKIRVMIAMGPVGYVEHMKGPLAWLAPFSHNIDTIYTLLGDGEFLPSRDVTDEWAALYCDDEAETAQICDDVLFLICGPDPELLNEEYLPLILSHTPAGTSVHTVNHYAQLNLDGGFRKYDYGSIGNENHYGSTTPPDYDFSKVDVPVALYWGPNDWLATPEDVANMAPELPNVVVNHRVEWDNFNHLDFVWATRADELVYVYVMDTLEQY